MGALDDLQLSQLETTAARLQPSAEEMVILGPVHSRKLITLARSLKEFLASARRDASKFESDRLPYPCRHSPANFAKEMLLGGVAGNIEAATKRVEWMRKAIDEMRAELTPSKSTLIGD